MENQRQEPISQNFYSEMKKAGITLIETPDKFKDLKVGDRIVLDRSEHRSAHRLAHIFKGRFKEDELVVDLGITANIPSNKDIIVIEKGASKVRFMGKDGHYVYFDTDTEAGNLTFTILGPKVAGDTFAWVNR